jgi:RNA polymerase sigma-70 factor (ECF subfamily)
MPPFAIEELLCHADWLRRLATHVARGGDSEEAVQETWIAALVSPPARDRAAAPWLAEVLRNFVRGAHRSGRARRRREERAAELPVPSVPSPEQLLERAEAQRLLVGLVVALDEPYRTAILLRYFEGLTAAVIARTQGVPAGTVRWRIKQGLARLRAELERRHGDGMARWLGLLVPTGERPAAPARPAGSLIEGALVMSTKSKLVTVVVLLLALLGAGGIVVRKASHQDATAARPPASRPRLRLAAGPAGIRATAAGVPEPGGALGLQGQVIDEAEAPVAGATVALDSEPPRLTTSSESGHFAFAGLRPRTYALEAHTEDLYAGPVRTSLLAGAEPVILRARPGTRLEVEVRAADAPEPIAGAQVELRSTLVWTGVTDVRGTALLTGVGPGWRPLRVVAAGFAPASAFVTTPAGQRQQRVQVQLRRGVAVSGRVLRPDGTALAGARVWARTTSEPFPVVDPALDAVSTDGRGQWRLAALAAGSYQFIATHDDWAETATPPLSVRAGAALDGVDIRMEPGGRLTGVVRGEDGRAVAAANVRVAMLGAVPWSDVREAWTDEGGRFRLTGMPRRALQVAAVHEEGATALVTADLSVVAEASVTLVLAVKGAIAGAVVNARGEPVPEAQVQVRPAEGPRVGQPGLWDVRGVPMLVSDAGGRFRFTGLPDGAYRVRAAGPGAAAASLALHAGTLARPGDKEVVVIVREDGSIRGKVAFDDGSPPPSFTITVGPVTSAPFVAGDGAFVLPVPAGTHDLVIEGPAFAGAHIDDVRVEEGASKDVGLVHVRRGRSLSGRVLEPDGTPVAHAEVAAGHLISGGGTRLNIPDEGFGVQETTSDDEGRFSLSGFHEMPLSIVAEREGKGRSATIALPRGPGSVQVDLVLQPTGSLEGRVTSGGRALPQTVVVARPRATQSNFFVVTGPDGGYALDTLTAGPYVVIAIVGKNGDRHLRQVTVEAGKRAHADVDVPEGTLSVTTRIETDAHAPVPVAQLALVAGAVAGDTMEAVGAQVYEAKEPVALYQRRQARGPARFEALPPGLYTACVAPLPVDPGKPVSLGPEVTETLPVRCVTRALARDDELVIVVPATWTAPPPKEDR